jgi:hypothetical protein
VTPTALVVDPFRVEWEQALAALELDVAAAEHLLAATRTGTETDAGLGSWAPPASIGPIPEDLVERARIVLARQLALVEEVATAAVTSRQHLEVHRRMRQDHPSSRPLFVDACF